MIIKATCPTCAKDYQVGENLIGKKIRCKNCQAVFAVESNPKAKIEDEEPVDVEPEESNKDKKGSSPARSKNKIKKNSKSKTPATSWFLGVLFATIVLVGGGATLWFIAKKQVKNQTMDADSQLITKIDQKESTKNQVAIGSDPELEKIIAELDQKEPGWRIEELEAKRKVLKPEENSALVISESYKLLGNFEQRKPIYELQRNQEYQAIESSPQQMLTPKYFNLIKTTFDGFQPSLVEARKVAKLPQGRFEINYSPNIIDTNIRCVDESGSISGLLFLDVWIQAQEGKSQQAMESTLAMFNLARSIGEIPFNMTYISRCRDCAKSIRALERTIGQGEPSKDSLSQFQSLLENEASFPMFLAMAKADRASFYAFFLFLRKDKDIIKTLKMSLDLKDDEAVATKLIIQEPNFLSWLLKNYNSLVAIANLPQQDQEKAVTALAMKLNEKPSVLNKIIFNPKRILGSNRNLATLNCAITGLAIERYRITNGKWPRKLEELVPEYLAKLPTDPFNGEPLLVGTILGGLVIYSVGPDLQDNNGLIDDLNPLKEGTDIGFRLWEVPMRRQPAK
jgi:hypothetical protein